MTAELNGHKPDVDASAQPIVHFASELVNWSGLFSRFYGFDDPTVNVVMVRDVDSPFTLRERLVVEDWLASELPFHVIRDHYNHSEPMRAGLWVVGRDCCRP